MNLTMKMKKGFTLIELLVVIAIIGILAALIITSLQTAREKAVDTQRKNNARNLDTALAQYYLDQNPQAYPIENGTPGGVAITSASLSELQAYLSGTAAFDSTLLHKYLSDATGTKYGQVWLLGSSTEAANITSGNGIYAPGATGDVAVPNGLTLTGFTDANERVFVTYGPQ